MMALKVNERTGAAGFAAGAVDAALCQTPSQAIQVKMVHDQAPNGPRLYRGVVHAVQEIYREFGIQRGFFGAYSHSDSANICRHL